MGLASWFNPLRVAAQREEGQTTANVLAMITLCVIIAIGAIALAIALKIGAITSLLN